MTASSDFADTTIRSSLVLPCESGRHDRERAPTLLTLGLEIHGPNAQARDMMSELLECASSAQPHCQACQERIDVALVETPEPVRDLTIDERLASTRQLLADIAAIWDLEDPASAVELSFRDLPPALYAQVLRHADAHPVVIGTTNTSWTLARFDMAGDTLSHHNIVFSIRETHSSATKDAFSGHWPQAFVPHKLAPIPQSGRCQVCDELVLEHTTTSKKDLFVWDPEREGNAPSGWGAIDAGFVDNSATSTPPVDAPEFGDEGHDSGSPDAEQRVVYANSMADTANSATSN